MKNFARAQMNVGVGDRDRVRFDRDDHHVRVGLADIVLNRKPSARSRGIGGEPGVAEFQLPRRLDPAHERLDNGPILRQQSMDMGAGQDLFGIGGGQTG